MGMEIKGDQTNLPLLQNVQQDKQGTSGTRCFDVPPET
jgi:hypothetical protein